MQTLPETTLAIILGASEFPNSSLQANEAFRNSAQDFKRYLLAKGGFGLPDKNLLDLFDSSAAPSQQNNDIRTFLDRRSKELKEEMKVDVSDLIIYYVGHGGFFQPNDQYFLALRCTDSSESISGYPIQTLAETIKEHARNLRRYLILDCCFSAQAYQSFQSSGPLDVARQQTQEILPNKGTALLCASGPRNPAKAPAGARYTMFSEALLEILTRGVDDLPEKISLRDLGWKTKDLIRVKFPDKAVRPEVHSPDQTQGDVSILGMFPNPGLDIKVLRESLVRLENMVSSLSTAQRNLETTQSSMATRLSDLDERITNVSISNPVSPYSLQTDEGFSNVLLRKYPWLESSGLTPKQWSELPASIRREVINYKRHRLISRWWLTASILIAVVLFSISLYSSIYSSTQPYIDSLVYVLAGICGSIAYMQITLYYLSIMRKRRKAIVYEAKPIPSSNAVKWYDDLDIVLQARDHQRIRIFELEIGKGSYVASMIVYTVVPIVALFIRFGPLL